MKWVPVFLATSLLFLEQGKAETNSIPEDSSNTETIYIPTDKPPPPSAEDFSQPFFAAPSTGNEVMEEIETHKAELKKLQEEVKILQEEVNKLKNQAKPQNRSDQ